MNNQVRESKTDRELSITRTIAAPRAKVYEAWTQHVPEWWGPHGTNVPTWEMDLRSGGKFHVVMEFEGTKYDHRGTFLEVSPDRIVLTDAFGANWDPNPEKFMVGLYEFEEVAEGTRLTAKALHWDEEARQKHEEMGFFNGWGQMLERLEAAAQA